MRFKLILEVPDEMIDIYQERLQKELNLHIDLTKKEELEELIADIVQEQTKWQVEKCHKINE